MAFALIENNSVSQYPISSVEIRRRFPNVSFPKPLDGADLSAFGIETIAETEQPNFDLATQRVREATPSLVDNAWQQTWNVIDLTADELQVISDRKAAAVRIERNEKLKACDWTVLTDSPLTTTKKTEWKAYRTALRDITTDSGFPHSVTWPTEPS